MSMPRPWTITPRRSFGCSKLYRWTRQDVIRVVSGGEQRVVDHHEELASGTGGGLRITPARYDADQPSRCRRMRWFLLVGSSRILRSVRYTVCGVGECKAVPRKGRSRGRGGGGAPRLRLDMMASFQALPY